MGSFIDRHWDAILDTPIDLHDLLEMRRKSTAYWALLARSQRLAVEASVRSDVFSALTDAFCRYVQLAGGTLRAAVPALQSPEDLGAEVRYGLAIISPSEYKDFLLNKLRVRVFCDVTRTFVESLPADERATLREDAIRSGKFAECDEGIEQNAVLDALCTRLGLPEH
jgi:hypothetical protein